MTVPQIKVTVVRKPQLKLKVLPRFPSNFTVSAPILLDRTGGNYAVSLDLGAIGDSLQALFLPASGIDASSVISGTFAAARLPTPTAATLGGVKSKTNVAHQWLNSIGADGLPTSTQPDGIDVTYTQTGTGAVTYTVAGKIGQVYSAKDFGVKGDGTTADAANLNRAISTVIALGAGKLKIPAGTYKCDGTQIIADRSAITTRFQGTIVIEGDGAGTVIQNATSAAACFKYLGNTASPEAYFQLRNIRFIGAASAAAAVTGSRGVEIDVAAFCKVHGVTAEGFEYGHDCSDVEQFEFSKNEWRFNKNGGVFRGVGSVTDTNSALVTNNQYTNNSLTGLTVNHANAFKMVGGSIQYNGLVGGASNTGGLFLQEAGTGYGTVNFDTVAFEGNGGMGDVLSTQTTNPARIKFDSCGFARTQTFGPTLGYGTNNINAAGTNANTIYILTGNTFRFFVGYTESAARPTIALNNTSCKIYDDGTNYFQSATEKLTYPDAQIVGTKLANTAFDTATSGNALKINGSTINAVTGSSTTVVMAVSPTIGGTPLIASYAGGTAANSTAIIASTTNGAPSGDAVNLIGSTINLTGAVAGTSTITAASSLRSTASPATAAHLDTTGSPVVTVLNGANAAIAVTGQGFGGLTVVDTTNGFQAKFDLNGGATLMTSPTNTRWDNPGTTPTAGKSAVSFSGSSYQVFNNTGGTVNYRVTNHKSN